MRKMIEQVIWSSPWRRAASVAPVLTVGLLVGLSWSLPNRVVPDPQAEAHKAEIARQMDAVPLIIGDWVGQDIEVPQEAQELLRPNAILSRLYTQPGEPWVQVVLVHCSDARDMIGHYPPVCYPAAGWLELEPDGTRGLELDAGTFTLPVQHYCYRRLVEGGLENRIRIFNAFILPNGETTRRIDDVRNRSERLAVAAQGVAQLQLVMPESVSVEEAQTLCNELLRNMQQLWRSLEVAQGGQT